MNNRPFESSDIFATRRLPASGASMTKACPFEYAATGHNQRLPTKTIGLTAKSEDLKHSRDDFPVSFN